MAKYVIVCSNLTESPTRKTESSHTVLFNQAAEKLKQMGVEALVKHFYRDVL